MIYVTQGHEKSIALEVFLKAFLLLTQNEKSNFTLICFKSSLLKTIRSLNINFKLRERSAEFNGSILNCVFLKKEKHSESLTALLYGINICSKKKQKSILITLPTSKDQLKYKNRHYLGYTEFFRDYFDNKSIPMTFWNEREIITLITDHIPLADVTKNISANFIASKITMLLKNYKTLGLQLNRVIFTGINPHCGENGLLGNEDIAIINAIYKLKSKFSKIDFSGPVSADAISKATNPDQKTLQVFMYHDQGLVMYKGKYSHWGINVTLGLPFLRLSVDHGTAFNLFLKNSANYSNCYYLLKKSLQFI